MPPISTNMTERFETPILTAGDSLVLRPAELDDAERFLSLAADNIERLSHALGVWDPPKTVEDRRKLMAEDLISVQNGDRHWWMIESGGQLAGAIDIHRIHHRARQGFVGYWLGSEFTGQGIMTRSLRAVIDWAFTRRKLIRLEIQSSIENRASCAVPERLGIRRESIRRQSHVIKDRAYDMASYAAFADNWPPKPPEKPLPVSTLTIDNELRLRPFSDDDQRPMWVAIDEARDYLGEFLPWVDQKTSFERHSSEFRKRQLERDVFGREATYIVEYRGKLAGTVGLHRPSPQNSAEIGYWLREDLQGRGIMTRSVGAVIEMAIVQMGMHRIVIRAGTSNLRSRGIPERLGFKHEGTLRDAALVRGEYSDLEVYSILDREWLARSSNA
ncbi:MAG: GNAT family N-acetyltransferase [Chloroflexi bacterium]|nr:GNAT family N-acetyltransferase [Chloroflexota bacterium]